MATLDNFVYWFSQEKVPDGHKCGYCDNQKGAISHGMMAYHMSTTVYQKLIDRGWRRSGNYCYKPSMDETCCPAYTIRQKCSKFKISKSQKKTLKKMTKEVGVESSFKNGQDWQVTIKNQFQNGTNSQSSPTSASNSESSKLSTRLVKVSNSDKLFKKTKAESFKVYKKYQMKVHKDAESKLTVKQWNDFLCDPPEKFQVDPKILASKDGKIRKNYEYEHTQLDVAVGDSSSNLNSSNVLLGLPLFSETGSEGSEDSETLQTHSSSPKSSSQSSIRKLDFGAYHLQYLLNGKIVAVGVIDILDHCMSSVYLYYDPDFEHLSLGTFTALYEIYLCQIFKIPYYYLGYYIHSCPKMKYKANYRPAELLCPISLKFTDLNSEIDRLLTENKFSPLDVNSKTSICNKDKVQPQGQSSKEEDSQKDEMTQNDIQKDGDLSKINLFFSRQKTSFEVLKLVYPDSLPSTLNLDIYYKLVGKELAEEYMFNYVSTNF